MKVKIETGMVEFLISEVELLRRQNEILSAENKVINNFFSMVDRLGPKQSVGYAEDKLWQAKREYEDAKRDAENEKPPNGGVK